METALEYQRRIEMQVREQKRTLIRERLEDTANQLSNWVSTMYALALRLDSYRRDDLLKQQRDTLPQEINRLVEQRKVASKPTVQTQLDQVLASKRQQWQTLRDLDDRMTQASLQLARARVASLAPELHHLLQFAAVFGPAFWRDGLLALLRVRPRRRSPRLRRGARSTSPGRSARAASPRKSTRAAGTGRCGKRCSLFTGHWL